MKLMRVGTVPGDRSSAYLGMPSVSCGFQVVERIDFLVIGNGYRPSS